MSMLLQQMKRRAEAHLFLQKAVVRRRGGHSDLLLPPNNKAQKNLHLRAGQFWPEDDHAFCCTLPPWKVLFPGEAQVAQE
jgi:hypothetical protein